MITMIICYYYYHYYYCYYNNINNYYHYYYYYYYYYYYFFFFFLYCYYYLYINSQFWSPLVTDYRTPGNCCVLLPPWVAAMWLKEWPERFHNIEMVHFQGIF